MSRVFDRALALSLVDDDVSLLDDLAERFCQHAPPLVVRMREQLDAGQLKDVARAAHSLRGSSSQIAAPETTEASLALEHAALEGRADLARAALARVERAVEQLLSVVR